MSLEDRTTVALTVAWMLALLCSLSAELASLTVLVVARPVPPVEGRPQLAAALAGGLLLAALVTGAACLLLTPIVWRLRKSKPPLAVGMAAVLVGLAPMITLVILYWLE